MNDTENKNEKPLDLNTTDLITQEHQSCTENIRYYGKIHWEINFIIMTAVVGGSILIFREGILSGLEIYKYLFAIIIINTWLAWMMLYIHLYFMRLVRVEHKYLKSLEENLKGNKWNGLQRFSTGEKLYVENERFLVFSEKTKYSIGFMLAYACIAFTVLLILSTLLNIYHNQEFYLDFSVPFNILILVGIITAIICAYPLYLTIIQVKEFWNRIQRPEQGAG